MDKKRHFKILIDILMSIGLIFVMAYQVTGDLYHEIIGTAMLALLIAHNILNRKWYGNLFKGKYSLSRFLWTVTNLTLVITILLTGYSGIAMSKNVYTFLTLSTGPVPARLLHLAGSYWSFALMGFHLGLHWSMVVKVINKGVKSNPIVIWCLRIAAIAIALYGAVLFYKADIISYMLLKNIFAFLDFEKSAALVLFENVAMMGCFVFISYYFMKCISTFQNITK